MFTIGGIQKIVLFYHIPGIKMHQLVLLRLLPQTEQHAVIYIYVCVYMVSHFVLCYGHMVERFKQTIFCYAASSLVSVLLFVL